MNPSDDQLDEVDVRDGTEQIVLVEAALDSCLRTELMTFLKSNLSCFLCSLTDMAGIDEEVITH